MGVPLDAKDKNGETALHTAVRYQQLETVRMLLEAGADPLVADIQGRRPLRTANDRGYGEIVKLLADAERLREAQ
jgi:ankyrin repeat protein